MWPLYAGFRLRRGWRYQSNYHTITTMTTPWNVSDSIALFLFKNLVARTYNLRWWYALITQVVVNPNTCDRDLIYWQVVHFCRSLFCCCLLPFGHCIVCFSLTCDFWWPHWYHSFFLRHCWFDDHYLENILSIPPLPK
jgi:hypothetical protein